MYLGIVLFSDIRVDLGQIIRNLRLLLPRSQIILTLFEFLLELFDFLFEVDKAFDHQIDVNIIIHGLDGSTDRSCIITRNKLEISDVLSKDASDNRFLGLEQFKTLCLDNDLTRLA